MKKFLVLVTAFCVLAAGAAAMQPSAIFAEETIMANEIGPSFQDWQRYEDLGMPDGTVDLTEDLVVTHYYRRADENFIERGLTVTSKSTNEIIAKGWGYVVTEASGAAMTDELRVVLKLEDGTWAHGKKGESIYWNFYGESENETPTKIRIYVITDSGEEAGRIFPIYAD